MMRRVEVAWPVDDPALRQRIIEECLVVYLNDQRDAWTMQADGSYVLVPKIGRKTRGAQQVLVQRYMKQGA